ncbi:hypothetical protein [uncultured Marinobacter sp.]|uniref:hypothetical protein n=2 Tax=Marinobacter TaxID=2742 RepID=UPI0030D7A484|tara:strand:+ start:2920 stop:3204 length:285 start_codon:yes stop_codon:yes gene_type:complete
MKKTPATTTKRLSSPRQYRALLLLMKGPRSVRELFDRIPCNGVPQLIGSLRDKGLQIDTIEFKTRDRDDKSVTYCAYVLHKCHRRSNTDPLAPT